MRVFPNGIKVSAIYMLTFLWWLAIATARGEGESVVSADVEKVLAEWNFERVGDLEGWQPNSHMKDVSVKDSILSFATSGSDPILELRPLIDIPTSPWQAIEIRMLATKDGIAEFFWSNTTQTKYGGFAPEKSTRFYVYGDGKWRTYRVTPFWHPEGKIIRLRFDPYDGASFSIDFIRVVQLKVPHQIEGAEFEFIGTDCAWRAIGGINLSAGKSGLQINIQDVHGYLISPPISINAEKESYISLCMSADKGEVATIAFVSEKSHHLQIFTFPIVADGKERTYTLDMLSSPRWQGRIIAVGLRPSDKIGAKCILRWVRVTDKPVGEPHIAITSFAPEDAPLRVGKPATLTAIIANRGGEPAVNVQTSLELPKGARTIEVDVSAAGVTKKPNGTIALTKLSFGDLAIWRWRVISEKPITGEARLHVKALNAPPVTTTLKFSFKPALKLPRASYVPEPKPVRGKYDVGVYYFPGWKTASQWMPIISFPERKPLLGWYREGDPEVADWHIKWAVEHGITFFAYDWYWVRGARQLEHALHDGYMRARYRHMLKFCLLWANHNPPNTSSLEDCIAVTRFWIEHYFRRPEYLTIDGKPVVIIFSTHRLSEDLGTYENVRKAFDAMRGECIKAGLQGLYIIACVGNAAHAEMAAKEGYDAVTAYNWPTLGMPPSLRRASFDSLIEAYRRNWEDIAVRSPIPLMLPISGGWDSRPWHGENALVRYGRTPENFRRHLQDAKRMLEDERFKGKLLPMVLIEAWNEWGEGSYIEPHAEFAFGYLDAIREVFTDAPKEHADITPSDAGLGPYEVTFLPSRAAWEFEQDDEGWANTMGMRNITVIGKAICAITTSNDPAFFGPPIRVEVGQFKFVHLRMRLRRLDGVHFKDIGQVFWRTATIPESEVTSVRFEVIGDGEWHDYVLNVSENVRWRGIITRLRLDPCTQPDVHVEVDFIKLIGER
ncbi:MAG: glycoside hydrolase family 99-like domain-containing protein [Armatimonadetes bacterium]|nr:glycoside hydrolase family 99-like domain-containing protein [Armatimonadota bacterium]